MSKPIRDDTRIFPTEAALVAESVDNGISTELEIPYMTAFRNLRQAYNHCVAFTANNRYVYTDNRLEEHLEQGTFNGTD